MIKVGQIYNMPHLGGKVVVTWIRADKTEFNMVRNDGFFFKGNIEHQSNFIAEYPTWQEAVNSKEFGGKPHINDDDDFEPLACHGCGDW